MIYKDIGREELISPPNDHPAIFPWADEDRESCLKLKLTRAPVGDTFCQSVNGPISWAYYGG